MHTLDWHRQVDVVCSNRILGMQPASSIMIVNERKKNSPSAPAHEKKKDKKRKTILTTAENIPGEIHKIDHDHLLVDQSTLTAPRDPFLAFVYHSTSDHERLWNRLFFNSFTMHAYQMRSRCIMTERKSIGVKKKASRDLGLAPA